MVNSTKPSGARFLTPPFRVSFPAVFGKRACEGQPKASGRYACTALFSGFEVIAGATSMRAPSSWSAADQVKWNAIVTACNEVAIAAFKKPMRDLDRAVYTLPFHRGEEKEYDGYGPGVVYFAMSARNRPGIIARDGVTPITQYGPEDFYAGCYARASVIPFANIQWKSLSIGLRNLQKLADGPRLDNFTPADDDGFAQRARSTSS